MGGEGGTGREGVEGRRVSHVEPESYPRDSERLLWAGCEGQFKQDHSLDCDNRIKG